jgi:pSer/pThr/pTyr-binding forkhead associated (FHA) protein
VSAKTAPEPTNGFFDAKVLSRNHAELTFDNQTVFIQDLKSSNGTFVNGVRLSEEGVLSPTKDLQSGDVIEFGVDIKDEDGKRNIFIYISAL